MDGNLTERHNFKWSKVQGRWKLKLEVQEPSLEWPMQQITKISIPENPKKDNLFHQLRKKGFDQEHHIFSKFIIQKFREASTMNTSSPFDGNLYAKEIANIFGLSVQLQTQAR